MSIGFKYKLYILLLFSVPSFCLSDNRVDKLYKEIYIVIEKETKDTLSINGEEIKTSDLTVEKLKEISSLYNSKMFLLGLNTKFIVNDFLKIGSGISEIGGKAFYYSSGSKSINEISFTKNR